MAFSMGGTYVSLPGEPRLQTADDLKFLIPVSAGRALVNRAASLAKIVQNFKYLTDLLIDDDLFKLLSFELASGSEVLHLCPSNLPLGQRFFS